MKDIIAKKQERKERYIGVYLDSEDRKKVSELAVKKTAQSGVKHSNSDIIRLAVKEFLEKNK